jgi:hypothetical protein
VKFFLRKRQVEEEWIAVIKRVAVAGWQWCQSKEEIKAVRMVPVKRWQWHYWQWWVAVESGRWQVAVCGSFTMSVIHRVAVAGWQWYHSKEKINAVILAQKSSVDELKPASYRGL